MSNVNYSWLKGTKCVNWRYIWPVFNQLSLTLHYGARLHPSSLLLVRAGSRSFHERVAESARFRVTSLTRSVCSMYVFVHPWMSNAELSAPLSLLVTFCASRSVIADNSAPRYIVANCWPLLRNLPGIMTDRLGSTGGKPGGRPKTKETYQTHNGHFKKYRFIIFFVFRIFLKTSRRNKEWNSSRSGTFESYTNINIDKSKYDRFRTHLKRIDTDNSINVHVRCGKEKSGLYL